VGGVDVGRVDGVGIWSVVRVTVLCWWTWLFMVALLLMVLSFEVAASNWRRLMTASRPRGLLLVLALFGVSSCCAFLFAVRRCCRSCCPSPAAKDHVIWVSHRSVAQFTLSEV